MTTIQKITMKTSALPAIIGKLSHSVQFLKVFSLGLLALLVIVATGLVSLLEREPVVVVTDSDSRVLRQVALPKREIQIEEALRHYLDLRYRWDAKTVAAQLKLSESFIAPVSLKAFRSAIQSVVQFSSSKGVSQRLFPSEMKIDLTKRTAQITGDRITAIQGVRVAAALKLGLDFEYGARTRENPWGIYITKETEEGL